VATRDVFSEDELAQLRGFPEPARAELIRYFTLAPADEAFVRKFRGQDNVMGVAVQLCTLPWLGFVPDEVAAAPAAVVARLSEKLGIPVGALRGYGAREQTRTGHLRDVAAYLGWRTVDGPRWKDLEEFLFARAMEHDSPKLLFRQACEYLSSSMLVRPGVVKILERVAAARERAREGTWARVAPLLTLRRQAELDELLAVDPVLGRTRLSWLGTTATLAYSITITAQPPDRLVCDAGNGGTLVNGVCVLPGASLGQPYEAFIITSNNSGGTFAIIAGSLPPGLSMPSSYGASGTIVAGTPTRQGTFTFTVKGTDQQGQPLQQAYSITVGPAPPLAIVLPASGPTLSPGQVGVAYAQNFFLSGGVAPYTWSVASGQLPPGLALTTTAAPTDNNNQLAGTPTTAGTFVFTMKVTDGAGSRATQQFSLTILPK
jgi:hypothetical protein